MLLRNRDCYFKSVPDQQPTAMSSKAVIGIIRPHCGMASVKIRTTRNSAPRHLQSNAICGAI